ncbi:MAG: D-glycerate dehydrogenase [Anaerolineae bacterium]|nr:D-glycerate dehydrogenase [Anaerolineae bacterium]
MKYQVFISRRIPSAAVDLLRENCDLDMWQEELPPSRDIFLEKVRGKQGLLTMLSDRIDRGLLTAAGRQLKVVANYAVGYDNIDLAAAREMGVAVGNTPGVLTETTADLAWALLMAVNRRIVEGDRYVREDCWKTWGPELLRGYEMAGKTIGIIGFGRIGKAVARRAAGFGMRTVFYSPSETSEEFPEWNALKVDLDTCLATADFLSLHCPLNEQTRSMVNAEALARMKPTAILVNTARGAVVDSRALYQALKSGALAGAGLDVTDPEPIPLDDPLLELPNVIITPHIGSATYETRAKMAEMAALNILHGLRGESLPYPVLQP